MKIMKAKIVWFPNIITNVTKDNLNFVYENKHLKKIKNELNNYGLYFPGVVMKNEIHSGHYRLKIAKEMGYDGIEMYEVFNYSDVNYLSRFNELCYFFLKKSRLLKKTINPQTDFCI